MLSVAALIGLVTLTTFDLLTSGSRASVFPILGFLGLSVLEFGRGTRLTDGQTDGQTDKQTPHIIS